MNSTPFADETITTCGCGVRIAMVPHERSGRPAPIELEPTADGAVTLNTVGEAPQVHVVSYHVLNAVERAQYAYTGVHVPRYPSHFQTCQQARLYRGPRA